MQNLEQLGFNLNAFKFNCSMVIENLKDVAPERKCFRLIGGVLVERTVKEVLPALTSNRDQVPFAASLPI